MTIQAYIYLPEGELALDILANNPQVYFDIISELSFIKKILKRGNFSFFYDSENVRDFISIAKQFIPVQYPKIEKQIATFISTNSKDVNSPQLRHYRCVYANWSCDLRTIEPSPYLISESVESTKMDTEDKKTICICLGGSISSNKTDLYVIRDFAKFDSPPEFVPLTLISGRASLVKWQLRFRTNEFSLENHEDFEPLNKFWNKERIYKQKSTGHLWYFDFYHRENKIHYEVYNHSGEEHIGEANADGNIDISLRDVNKKISNCL